MARQVALLMIAVVAWGCAGAAETTAGLSPAPSAPAPLSEAPLSSGRSSEVASSTPTALPAPEAATPTAEPPADVERMTEYERELLAVLREDVREASCAPRRAELPAGAAAGVECRLDTPLVDRVAVYGFASGTPSSDGDRSHEDRAVFAYLERMHEEGVLGEPGDCAGNTPADVSWQGPEADQSGTDHYLQVQFDGRPYSIARYGCFENEQGMANFRATCTSGTYIGVLGRTRELDRLTDWALRWPDPDELAFPMPGICAGLQRDTY